MRYLLLLALAGAAFGATITQSSTPNAGTCTTLTSTSSGNWAVPTGSTATLSGTTTGTTTVTACVPAGPIYAVHQELGCPVSPNDSIFNTNISALPVESRSSAWLSGLAGISAALGAVDVTWEPNSVTNSTPTISSPNYLYTTAYNGIPIPMLYPPNRKRETGAIAGGLFDSHMVMANANTCQWTELYHDFFGWGPQNVPPNTANSEWQYSGYGYPSAINGATNASGICFECMTPQYTELLNGTIHHALSFTLAGGYIQMYNTTGISTSCPNCGPLWPATPGAAALGCSGPPYCPSGIPNWVPYGARLRLKSSYSPGGTCGTECTTLLNTLKNYGMYLYDASFSTIRATAGTTLYSHPDSIAALGQLAALNISVGQFDIVDESSLMTDPNTGQAPTQAITSALISSFPGPGQAGGVVGSNTYVTPANSMMVSETVGGSVTYYPVQYKTISVGYAEPFQYIVGGASYTPTVIVNGTSTTPTYSIATCSLGTGNCGTYNSSGIYTAPAVTCGVTFAATLTATIGTLSDNLYLTGIHAPTAPCPLAFAPTAAAAITGADGTIWMPWQFARLNEDIQVTNYPAPQSDWSSGPTGAPIVDGTTYQNSVVCTGDCVIGPIYGLSAGNYDVTSYWGQGSNGEAPNCYYTQWNTKWNPFSIQWVDVNGIVTHHQFDPYATDHFACYTPITVTDPLTATSGNPVYVAWRSTSSYGTWDKQHAEFTKMKIVPDTVSTAHITVDAANASIVAPASSTFLWDVPWFIGSYNFNLTTWSITSGPGTISSTCQFSGWCMATYVAPSSQVITAPVVIKATNGSFTATTTLYVKGSQVPFF